MLRMKDEEKEDVDIYVVHAESHDVEYCTSLPILKEVYQEEIVASQLSMQLCYVAQRGPW